MPLYLLPEYGPGEIIPSGWAVNISRNFGLLDARTQGDPGAPGLFLASQDATRGTWRALVGADYKTGTIPDTALVNQKVNTVNPISTTFGGLAATGRSGFYSVYPASDASGGPAPNNPYHVFNLVDTTVGPGYTCQIAVDLNSANNAFLRVIVNGTAQPWQKIWHNGNTGNVVDNTKLAAGAALANIGPLGLSNAYLAAGAALANIGYTPVNKAGDSNVGSLVLGTGRQLSFAQQNGTKIDFTSTGTYVLSIADFRMRLSTSQYVEFWNYAAGGPSLVYDTYNHILTINTVRVPTNGGATVLNSGLNAEFLGGQNRAYYEGLGGGGGGGTTTPHTHVGDNLVPNSLASSSQLISHAPNGTPPLVVDSGTMVANLNVARVGGKTADELLSGGASPFSTGMIMYFDGSPVPTGWLFVSSTYQGKFLVSAGGTFPVSGAGSSGGSSTHGHGNTFSFGHSGGAVGADGSTAIKVSVVTPGDANAAQSGHGHGFTQPGAHSGAVTDAGHLPPYIAVNMIRKT